MVLVYCTSVWTGVYIRVDNHDLAFLTMWSSCTVQEHGFSRGDWHVEGSDLGLTVLERDVAAVDTGIHGRACCVGSALGHGMITVAELELHDVANCCNDGVRDEGVLWSTNNYRNDLVGAAVRFDWSLVSLDSRNCDGTCLECWALCSPRPLIVEAQRPWRQWIEERRMTSWWKD